MWTAITFKSISRPVLSMFKLAVTAADRLFPSSMFPKSFMIIIVGLDGAGTTSMLNRLHRRELPMGVLPATIPTIANNTETIPYGRHRVKIQELGGMDKIRPLWRSHYWNAHAFIFVLDAAAPDRFPEAKEELDRVYYDLGKDEYVEYPFLIVANKMDLPGAADLATIAKALGINLETLGRGGRTVAMKGVSAMSGEGLDEVLQWFVDNVSHELIVQHIHYQRDNAAKPWFRL
ncbi:ADP-ribosylation factor family-domain-containing protein [Mycena rosella]|uniref:ADP-ribosylation factor n=1 Tax=Mycena rosella TaxID=1033263 RepID=A0AAD7DTB5_MYCRO|nr:ADP-ribosylation factor family-domain-containing protein [Mycena rosella]